MFESLIQTPLQWGLLFFCALLVGMSKTGIQGIGTLTVPIMAFVFGAKQSTGIVLPILCIADVIAVIYYRRNTELKHVIRLIPWAVVGLFVAIAVDKFIPPTEFKKLMGLCILFGLVVMFWSEKAGKVEAMAKSPVFAPAAGILGGFTTMIGNAAGPVMSVYLLSMRLPKYIFVSTGAWFFLTVNYLKLPLQIFFWKNITTQTFLLDLTTIPFIGIGAVLGTRLVKWLPEEGFRKLIIVLTIFSAFMLLF
jgi:uncharacterized membrane protein YfcA